MFKISIIPGCGQSQTRKTKMVTYYSEITAKNIDIHCNTLHCILEFTATQCISGNKMRPDDVARTLTGPRVAPEYTAAKKVLKYCRQM